MGTISIVGNIGVKPLKVDEPKSVVSKAAEKPKLEVTSTQVVENDKLIPVNENNEVKLFTSGSLPLEGRYEVMLKDKNEDGRVDARDAISEYMLIATQSKLPVEEQPTKEPLETVA